MLNLSICGATGTSEVIFSITTEYYRLEHLELIIVFDWHRCMNSGVRLEFLCLCCFYVISSDSGLGLTAHGIVNQNINSRHINAIRKLETPQTQKCHFKTKIRKGEYVKVNIDHCAIKEY